MPASRPLGSATFGGLGLTQSAQTFLMLQVGPLNVNDQLVWRSQKIKRELNGRDELEFSLINITGYVPAIGESVRLFWRQALAFVGTVHERDVQFISEGDSVYTTVSVRCVDINEVADRRIVTEVYENQSAGDIVVQIVTKYLVPENISHGDIQDGPLVSRMVIPYLTVADTLDELCEQSGFHWNIDNSQALNFFSRETSPAPFTVTSANAVFRGMRGSRTRNQYRNVQYVDGGRGITDPRIEQFIGDGTLRTFNVEYPLFETPTIQRNFSEQTVGIRGVDEGKQWYWNSEETAIGHDPSEPVMVETDHLIVSYRGTFDLVSVVEDSAAILERQSVEFGTGRYEQVHTDDNIDGQDLVQEKGLSLLRRYASLDDVVQFEVDTEGLDVGQLLSINVPELGLVDSFLITNIDISWVSPDLRRFIVTATTGELKGQFQDFFAQLLGGRKAISIREGEVLQEVASVRDLVGVTDISSATLTNVTFDVIGTAEVGFSEAGA
jgi:hypothetical protein